MKTWLRREGPPLALLLLAAIGFFWQATLGGKVLLPVDNLNQFPPWSAYAPQGFSGPYNSLISDSILENYGWKTFLLDSIRQHQLPLWNPYVLGGTPFFAPGQASVLYPFTLLFLLLPLAPAYGWFGALHLFFAGACTYAFLRACDCSRPAGIVGGLAYMFSGRLVTSILWPQMIGAIVFLPLLLLCVELIVRQAPERWPVWPLLGGAVVLGVSILAGHIEASVYVMAAMGLYAFARLVQLGSLTVRPATSLATGADGGATDPGAARGRGGSVRRAGRRRTVGRAAGCCAALVVLGVGMAAVQLLPFYEVGSLNFRSGAVTYQDVVGFALKLPQLFTFVMPDFYGNPIIHWAPYWGVKDYVEQASYVGILPLLLAGFTLLALRARPQIAALWFVIAV
ncbi:MAG: hypothetical protein JO247_01675, partial [Chloroflexi bacterium]|nr:hypothetical protein [Chloroflexota bacterium]